MYKKPIAILFTVIFTALIVSPTIISALDDSIDTSIFYSITEEESSKSKIIPPFSLETNDHNAFFEINKHQFFGYQFKNYAIPHLNLISPPPEKIIL